MTDLRESKACDPSQTTVLRNEGFIFVRANAAVIGLKILALVIVCVWAKREMELDTD